MGKPDPTFDVSDEEHMQKANEIVEDRLARTEPAKLAPSGDAEHDAYTDQALGYDALHPLRDGDKKAVHDEVVADSQEDATDEHSD